MKNKYEKQKWTLNYIKNNTCKGVDILNSEFIDGYILKFKPKWQVTNWGANKCKELTKLLSDMYKCNLLNRFIVGLAAWQLGFPKWVYVYKIKEL